MENSIPNVAVEYQYHKNHTHMKIRQGLQPPQSVCVQVPHDLASMIPRVNNQPHILEIPPRHPSSIYYNVYTDSVLTTKKNLSF
jgi:hypothetical protein